MKRNLALLLILTLLLTLFSFAESDTMTAGQYLKQLGVIKGDAEGNLNEKEKLTREQAITTVVRLMGKEKEALATKYAPTFNDVPADSWAKPYITYAEMKEWTNGIKVGEFGYGQNLTTKQYVTYMLRVLGYGDTPYDKSMIQAAKLGLLDNVVATKGSAIIKRADVFVIMKNTLNTKPKDSEKQLIYVLGLLKDEAEPAKPEPKPEDKPEVKPDSKKPEVKEVIADSLKRFRIVLTAPIENVGDYDNYSLDSDGKAVIDSNSIIELANNNSEIVVTMTKPATQQDKADLEISDIFAKKEKIKDIEFLDRTIPEVTGVDIIGKDKIKVTFSEPMKVDGDKDKSLINKDNYKIVDKDGDNFYVDKVTANKAHTAAIIELYSDMDGDVEVSVKNVEDYAGFTVIGKKAEVDFKKDDKAPKLVGYKAASLRKVTLVFDEDIVLMKDHNAFYHTNTGSIAETAKADGKDLVLTFAKGDEMPAGTAYLYIKGGAIKDNWGNTLDGKQSFEITVTTDKTAPKVDGEVKVTSQRKVEIKFDEAIEKNSDFDVTLLKDGDIVKVGFDETIKDDVLTVKFDEDLFGKYKLIIEGIEDDMSNAIEKTALSFEADDETPPVVADFKAVAYKIDEKEQLLIVQFGEEMKESDILDKENYRLDGDFLDALDDIKIKTIDKNRAVQISVPEKQFDFTDSNLDKGNKLLEIGKLSDAAGNKMNKFSVTVDIENGDKMDIALEAVRLISDKKIEFEIDGKLSDVTLKQFVVFSDGDRAKFAGDDVGETKDGNTLITFTLVDSVSTDPKEARLKYLIRDKDSLADDDLKPSKNRYGQNLAGKEGDIADKCPPKVDKVVLIDDDTIYVYFTEDLDSGYIAKKGKNGFSVGEGELKSASLHESKKNVIVLNGEDFTKNSDVIYEDSNIYDLAGNEMQGFKYREKLKTVD